MKDLAFIKEFDLIPYGPEILAASFVKGTRKRERKEKGSGVSSEKKYLTLKYMMPSEVV